MGVDSTVFRYMFIYVMTSKFSINEKIQSFCSTDLRFQLQVIPLEKECDFAEEIISFILINPFLPNDYRDTF